MSNPPFHLPDEPSDLSLRVLTLSLRSDCEKKGVSPKNYAHRSRVIRQQTELLARVTHSGTVQSFNDASGRGSIRPDDGGSDVGFETSDLSVVGMGSPKVGSRFTYHLRGADGDANAVDVRLIQSLPSDKHRTTFTILRSAAEELAMKRDVDVWNNEGGHMSSSSGLVVSTPGSALPYKAILSHQGRNDSEHPFLTVREAEAFIRRNTPVPPACRTLYDLNSSVSPLKGRGG
jgi:cold shock CspA family protein